MAALPDRFDLAIRKARTSAQPGRQLDLCLGTLYGQPEWFLVNRGTAESPIPVTVDTEGGPHLLIFSSGEKMRDALDHGGLAFPAMTLPVAEAGLFCLALEPSGVRGLLVNPGPFAFAVSLPTLRAFDTAWRDAGGPERRGFWIPNTTTEEDDFWDELGVD